MKYLRIALALLITASVSGLKAQDFPIQNLSFKKSLKMADYLYSIGSFYNASQYYEAVDQKQAGNAYVVNQVADCQFKLRDYKAAEEWYKKLVDMNDAGYPLAPYLYGQTLMYNGKYDEAKKVFDKFSKEYKGPDSQKYKKLAKNQSKGCDFATQKMAKPDTVKVTHIGATVNNPYTDFAPLPLGDTALLFASLKSDSIIMLDEMKKNNKYAQFYISDVSGSSKAGWNYDKGREVKWTPWNDANTHVGNGTMSPDKKRFYFTKCQLMNDTMKMHCEIYVSEFKDGKWSDPARLDDIINMAGSTNTQPAVAMTKQGEVFYWVSDRPNGEGGLDIWFATRDKSGKFMNPQNAGRKINTEGDETTPFYDSKTGTLYFSSNGMIGMGGSDIFRTKGSQKRWENPINMGYPINSSVDDMYFVMDDNGYSGYVVSNRPGTISVKSETCCDDIWRIEYPKKVYYAVRGNVYDMDTRELIPGAKVMFLDDKSMQIGNYVSRKDTLYFFNTKPFKSYSLKSTKEGYLTGSASFAVSERDDNDTMRVDIYMKKIPKGAVRIQNIFYGFDSANLRPESKPGLDSLYQILIDNPAIQVEISSHTDSKGNDKYNMKLSQARAQSVVDYMISKGISSDRMVAKGYGESKPIAPNTLPNGKDNPEGRQLNRRTEFKVIGTIPGKELIYDIGNPGFEVNPDEIQEQQPDQEDQNEDKEDK
ncbi:MAG: OmpA family protein [Chitinophagales bacterium]|nr:OmpA family protein [Bacteroidota bacterium]MBX7139519.1 OmpA family protein [Chitinophagales bacterium]